MNEREEERLTRLLQSVEREENEYHQRPTGSFSRQLFSDELEGDQFMNDEEEDDNGIGVLQDIGRQEQFEDENVDFPLEFDDFDDMENIPLTLRLKSTTVTRQNGKIAYISKDKKMLWDLLPPTQGRVRDRNIIRIRMGHATVVSRNCSTPIDVWKLFLAMI